MKSLFIIFSLICFSVEAALPVISEDQSVRAIIAIMEEDFNTIKRMVLVEKVDPNFSNDGTNTIFDDLVNEILMKDVLGYKNLNFTRKKADILNWLIDRGVIPNRHRRGDISTNTLNPAMSFKNDDNIYYGDYDYIKYLHTEAGFDLDVASISVAGTISPLWTKAYGGTDPKIMNYIISYKPDFHKQCRFNGTFDEHQVRNDTKIWIKRDPNYVHPGVLFFDYVTDRYSIPSPFKDLSGFLVGLNRICEDR